MLAADRIFCWTTPKIIQRRRVILNHPWRVEVELDRERSFEITWEPRTRIGHGAGLLRYAEYCALRGIPEDDRFPVSAELASAFVASACGRLGTSAIRTWLAGLQAWHTYHGFEGPPSDNRAIKAALEAAKKQAPLESKRPPRPPVQMAHLQALYTGLDFTSTFDVAVWAAAATAFWGLARLGELTTLGRLYDPTRHVLRGTSLIESTAGGITSFTMRIPWTKTTQTLGAALVLTAEADRRVCPVEAIRMHLRASPLIPKEAPFFSFATADGGWAPLEKVWMMRRCTDMWSAAGLSSPTGHSFRIGGTSHLLSRGTDVKIVQRHGRWSSDAFYLYWRNAQDIIPQHIASAAERSKLVERVEKYLEGADEAVKEAWERVQIARQGDTAPSVPQQKKSAGRGR